MVTNNLTGLSTDTKPYAEEESLFYELDTGNWYYCTGGNAWTKVDGLSGVKVDNALIGKSTDGKPNASENTIFIETDTGKTYYRNGSSWAEIPSGGGGGSTNQYIVELGTTTPRMVYEAIQQEKSIAVLKTTSNEVTDTFPPTDDMVEALYNNIIDATPVFMYYYVDTDTEAGTAGYELYDYNFRRLAYSDEPDVPFEQ